METKRKLGWLYLDKIDIKIKTKKRQRTYVILRGQSNKKI